MQGKSVGDVGQWTALLPLERPSNSVEVPMISAFAFSLILDLISDTIRSLVQLAVASMTAILKGEKIRDPLQIESEAHVLMNSFKILTR